MSLNSENILSTQTHPGDSVVTTITGAQHKGDGFYGRSDGLHTIQVTVTGFIGKVAMQGTLAAEPTESDWFAISNAELIAADEDSAFRDGSFMYNFTGNYVWVRAVISDWTDGSVNSILLNH